MRLLTRFLWTLTRREKVGRLAQLRARCDALQNQRDNALEETWRLGRECNYQREAATFARAKLDGEAPQTDNPPAHGPYLVAVAGYRHWLAGYWTANGWRVQGRAGIASPVTHWRRMPAMPVDRAVGYQVPSVEECKR